MTYTFSDNISSVRPSAIREILKMVACESQHHFPFYRKSLQ
jgi:hypothetical protein